MTKYKQNEFDRIFDSLLPELKTDLQRIDYRLRTISTEAGLSGVNAEAAHKRLAERFWNLAAEVAKEATP